MPRNFTLSLALACCMGLFLPAQAKRPKAGVPPPRPVDAKDLLDRTQFPSRFTGYVVHKASSSVVSWFLGTWIESPAIVGGGSASGWSRRAAKLQPAASTSPEDVLAMSFNLGQKDGRWAIRMLTLVPDERNPGHFKPSPLTDEGPGALVDGRYQFEMEKLRLVLIPGDSGWKPSSLRLFRFLGDDFSAPANLSPSIAATVNWGPTQLAPMWAAGSYLLLENPPYGQLLYRGFGEQGNTWMVRYVREGEAFVQSDPVPYEGSKVLKVGTWPMAGLYANGLGFAKDGTLNVSSSSLNLLFKDPTRLEEIQFDGVAKGLWTNPRVQFSIHGVATEIAIPEATRTEILSRCADPQWLASGGPYSPQKLFNTAFSGCTAQFPIASVSPGSKPWAEAGNQKNLEAYTQLLRGWVNAFQESGVVASRVPLTRTKPSPLGLILTADQVARFKSSAAPTKQ